MSCSAIPEEDWAGILAAFPAKHRVAVRAEIEAARKDYEQQIAETGPRQSRRRRLAARKPSGKQRELWQRIAKLLESAAVRELRQLIPRVDLNKLPDPSFVDPLAPDRHWLPRLKEYLSRGAKIAKAYADLSRPPERLYARLFRIWTEAGLKLSVSANGPLARFVQDVTDHLLPRRITGDAVKIAVLRELERRRMKATLKIGARSFVIFDNTIIKGKTIGRPGRATRRV
jgi:hypothetical protein